MVVDFAIELGREDETLELPWTDSETGRRYYDLKRQPDLLLFVEEASRIPDLGEFLEALNSPAGAFETGKCDVWSSTQMNPEDEIFGAECKFGSYVDLLFSDESSRVSFSAHEAFVRRVTDLLKCVPEIPAAAEFLVRRCYYHRTTDAAFPCESSVGETGVIEPGVREGFYITFYLFGYGDDEATARRQWGIGMKLVENALKQVSAASVSTS